MDIRLARCVDVNVDKGDNSEQAGKQGTEQQTQAFTKL